MTNKIIGILQKPALKNFLSLALVQGGNFLLPLLTVPFVSRMIGVDKYGLVAYANSIVTYFVLIVAYGFDFTATRKAINIKSDITEISTLFYSVFTIKLLLVAVCFIILILLFVLFPKIGNEKCLFLATFIIVAGNLLAPMWLFQAMEKLPIASTINFSVKLIFTIFIFMFIREPTDYCLVALFTSLGVALGGFVSFYQAIKIFHIKLIKPRLKTVLENFKEGFTFFISTLVINIYTTTNITILGAFATNSEVGYFSSAFRVVSIFTSVVMTPLNLTIFPKIGLAFRESTVTGFKLLNKVIFIVIVAMTFVSALLLIFSELIVQILFGAEFTETVHCLVIISFLPLIIGISNIYGLQGLLNLKKDKTFFYITLVGAVISLLLNFHLSSQYKHIGASWAWLFTELFITFACFVAILRYRGKIN